LIRGKREPRLGVTKSAFPFQVDAFEAVRNLEYAAIFHEQGLGKTKIAIDLMMSWLEKGDVDSVIVVTKKSLVANWVEETSSHTYLTPSVLTQNGHDNYFRFNSPARLYLTHYEVCKTELDRLHLFLRTRRVGAILDEAQKIKNPDSALTKALHALSGGFVKRVIMTGTPVANRPHDIWSQVKFLDAGKALGNDFRKFKSELELTGELGLDDSLRRRFEGALGAIYKKIALFTVRETKETAGIRLPSKEIRSCSVELEERQAELYGTLKNELRLVVVRNGLPTMDDAEDILKRLLRLVQVASNPALVDESYNGEPGKLPVLLNMVDEILAAEAKVIIWTTFTRNVDWLARILRPDGAVRVHGRMSIKDRNSAIARFKSDDSIRIMVATPGAAKEGLTLTVANMAIFYDRGFSLDDYIQAQDRIHRISQDKPCTITKLLARDTVDEWVDELLAAKQLAARLMQGDIDMADYRRKASYDFGQVLAHVLEND